jgi:hypothetical protein
VLAIQIEACYQSTDELYEYDKCYPVIAMTKSDDIDVAVEVIQALMSENDWGDFNILKYGEVKGPDSGPKSIARQKIWQQTLSETGAIYIVYK